MPGVYRSIDQFGKSVNRKASVVKKCIFKVTVLFGMFLLTTCFNGPVIAKGNSTVWLSSLDLSKMSAGWGQAQANKSITGEQISINLGSDKGCKRGVRWSENVNGLDYPMVTGPSPRRSGYDGEIQA